MKGWRVKIFNLKPIVFGNTDLVENKELFIIDYDGWNRDHPKRKQGLNNDDLEIVEGSPSPVRSPDRSMSPDPNESMVVKKKGAKGKSKKKATKGRGKKGKTGDKAKS